MNLYQVGNMKLGGGQMMAMELSKSVDNGFKLLRA
jgi:hypothetical protein